MYNVLYTKQAKQAKQDIHEIYNFIAHDNELYAEKVVQSITGFVGGMLAVFPNIGQIYKKENICQVVETTFKYKIIYRIYKNTIMILTVYKRQNR